MTPAYTLELCYYHGRSCISRMIECFTWGEISHVAVRDPGENCVWEAWQKGGFSKVPSISTNHTDRTQVDVYTVDLTEEQYRKVVQFLDKQVGLPYDYWGVASFVFRRSMGKEEAWFCSEAALAAFMQAGISLLVCPPCKASPTILSYNPVQYGKRIEYTSKGG